MPEFVPTVFVIEPDPSMRALLELLIRGSGWSPEIVASAAGFVDRPRRVMPACLILELGPADRSGLELVNRLAADHPDLPVIVISGEPDVALTVAAMKAGAMEFLPRPLDGEILATAIRQALERSAGRLAVETAVRELRDRYRSLSRREREVMTGVVAGRLNKQVAGELGISEITVKAHRARVMRKMGADSLAGLVNMALRIGVSSAPIFRTLPFRASASEPTGLSGRGSGQLVAGMA